MLPNDDYRDDIPEEIREKLESLGVDPDNAEVVSGLYELKKKLSVLGDETASAVVGQLSAALAKSIGAGYVAHLGQIINLTCADLVPALKVMRMSQLRGQKWYEPQKDSKDLMKKYSREEYERTCKASDEHFEKHGHAEEDFAQFTLAHMLETFQRAAEIAADIQSMYLKEIGHEDR